MKESVFRKLEEYCEHLIRYRKAVSVRDIRKTFGDDVTYDAVVNLRRQMYQRHVRRTAHIHRQTSHLDRYIQRYNKGERIMDIAASCNFSPYLLARIMIERILGVHKKQITALIRDLSLINDVRLRSEVSACIDVDADCSPFVDQIKESVGAEYEYILQEKLRNRGIPFESEDALRQQGLSKTPDVKLCMPLGVAGPDGRARVVNWIDSKAMFGDLSTHERENAGQLQAYVNRYGPGLVIYWFGFVDSLNAGCVAENALYQDGAPQHDEEESDMFGANNTLLGGGGSSSNSNSNWEGGAIGSSGRSGAAGSGGAHMIVAGNSSSSELAKSVLVADQFPQLFVLPGASDLWSFKFERGVW